MKFFNYIRKMYIELEETDPAKHVRLSENGLVNLRQATLKDDTLTELTKVIHNGWPKLKQDIQPSIRTYWPYRDKLVANNNIKTHSSVCRVVQEAGTPHREWQEERKRDFHTLCISEIP